MNIKRIKDNILYIGVYTPGNSNDEVNLINRCAPSLSPEESGKLIKKINKALSNNKYTYKYSTNPQNDAVFEVQVGGNYISFV